MKNSIVHSGYLQVLIHYFKFKYFKQFFLFLLSLTFSFNAFASHIKGGEITWQCLGASSGANAGKYVFQLKLYRDCNGIVLTGGTEPLGVVGNPTVTTINCFFISQTDLTPPGCGLTCATTPFGSGNYQAVEEFLYRSNPITLTGVPPASGWIFYWDNICCRNNVDNVTGENNMLLRSKMFAFKGQNANPCFDSSPFFAERPTSFLCIGYEFNYNNVGFDNDFDAITYSWDYALDGNSWANADSLFFVPPYSVDTPLPGNPILDTVNGQLTIFPQTGFTPQGNFVTVIRANGYRCHQKIAEVYREIQISLSTACPQTMGGANQPPGLNPAPFFDPNTGQYTSFNTTVFAGDIVSFVISVSELDININGNLQVATLNPLGPSFATNYATSPPSNCSQPPCAYFTEVSAPYTILIPPILTSPLPIKQVRFFWPTSCEQVLFDTCNANKATHLFVLTLKDDACPVPAYNTRTVSITVKGPQIYAKGDTLITDFPNGTLQWYKNGAPLLGETDSIYIASVSGNYYVVATLPGSNCQISSNEITAGPVSINDIQKQGIDFNIYPNPAKDHISVEISSTKNRNAEFNIVDLTGREIVKFPINISKGKNKLDFNLPIIQQGIYIAKARLEGMELMRKFVVQ